MNEIKKTTLHPDNQPNVDLYPKTSADQVESLDARIKALSTYIYKVPIDLPKGAKNGNITQSQLAILQASEFSCIEMINDKELYYLNDPGHEEGFLTYSHVGIENSKTTIKTLTITVSAKSFVIVTTVVPTESGGGKLYMHEMSLYFNNEYVGIAKILSSQNTAFEISQIIPDLKLIIVDFFTVRKGYTGGYIANDHGTISLFTDFSIEKKTDNTLAFASGDIISFDAIESDNVTEL